MGTCPLARLSLLSMLNHGFVMEAVHGHPELILSIRTGMLLIAFFIEGASTVWDPRASTVWGMFGSTCKHCLGDPELDKMIRRQVPIIWAPVHLLVFHCSQCLIMGSLSKPYMVMKAKSYSEINNEPMKAKKDEQGNRCPYYGHLSPYPLGERRVRGQVPILWAPVPLSSWRALGDQVMLLS